MFVVRLSHSIKGAFAPVLVLHCIPEVFGSVCRGVTGYPEFGIPLSDIAENPRLAPVLRALAPEVEKASRMKFELFFELETALFEHRFECFAKYFHSLFFIGVRRSKARSSSLLNRRRILACPKAASSRWAGPRLTGRSCVPHTTLPVDPDASPSRRPCGHSAELCLTLFLRESRSISLRRFECVECSYFFLFLFSRSLCSLSLRLSVAMFWPIFPPLGAAKGVTGRGLLRPGATFAPCPRWGDVRGALCCQNIAEERERTEHRGNVKKNRNQRDPFSNVRRDERESERRELGWYRSARRWRPGRLFCDSSKVWREGLAERAWYPKRVMF